MIMMMNMMMILIIMLIMTIRMIIVCTGEEVSTVHAQLSL